MGNKTKKGKRKNMGEKVKKERRKTNKRLLKEFFGATIVAIIVASAFAILPSGVNSPDEVESYHVDMNFTSNIGSDTATFGAASDATNGFDPYWDAPQPPAPPSPLYLQAYFYYPENEGISRCLTISYHNLTANIIWPLVINVVSVSGSENVTVSWNTTQVNSWPDYNITLETPDSDIDMGNQSSYTYENLSGGYHAYNITAVINDTTPPKIINVKAIPDSQEVNGYVNISCDVTDIVGVDTVMVNITGPAGFTPINVSMDEVGSGYYYNDTYSIVGTYDYFIWANDTSNNGNTSNTYQFTVYTVDNTPPEITDNTPSTGYTGDSFTFNATITDNIQVSHAWVEYWYGTSSHTNVSMNNIADDYWEKTITINDALETLHYIISTNDTSNNWNNTGQKDVTIYDNDLPEITNVTANPYSQTVGGYMNITCDVTDNVKVDEVWVNITYPDSTTHNFSMNPGSYYFNQTYSILGTYDYFIWANDTSGNGNTSATYTFKIRIEHKPSGGDGGTLFSFFFEIFTAPCEIICGDGIWDIGILAQPIGQPNIIDAEQLDMIDDIGRSEMVDGEAYEETGVTTSKILMDWDIVIEEEYRELLLSLW